MVAAPHGVRSKVEAPAWALFHIRPDGQEFIEQVQRPGYMILFNLILRIPLAMFGLMFSMLMIDAVMWFESVTFIPAFLGATANEGYGIFGIVAAFAMLAFLHWQICLKSFGLITHLPDQVSRWFGQAGERLGEDQDTKMLVGGMVKQVEGRAQIASGAGALGAGGRPGQALGKTEGDGTGAAPGATAGTPGGAAGAAGGRGGGKTPAAGPKPPPP